MKRRKIEYAIDTETGLTWSKVGEVMAMPVMTQELMDDRIGRYPEYTLRKVNVLQVPLMHQHLNWTEELPTSIKNYHRRHWGLRKLRERT